MNKIKLAAFLVGLSSCGCVSAQTTKQAKYHVFIDVAHKQKFWANPAIISVMNRNLDLERVKYLNAEITKTATSVNADIGYLTGEIKFSDLAKCNLLFIHIPSAQYTPTEVDVVTKFVNNGGSLFLVMDSDYWSTLKQTNVNDLIRSFGIQFEGSNPDKLSGGSTRAGLITSKRLKISYHGARIVTGGTPFCFNDRTEKFPFGVFQETKNGGKIIVMGDGMTSLYMTSWENVNNYQCGEFMHDAFQWLLE